MNENDEKKIKCRRCGYAANPVVQHNRRSAFTCCPSCGLEIRLNRAVQPVLPRNRPHMKKKERLRLRAQQKGAADGHPAI